MSQSSPFTFHLPLTPLYQLHAFTTLCHPSDSKLQDRELKPAYLDQVMALPLTSCVQLLKLSVLSLLVYKWDDSNYLTDVLER